MKHIVSDASYPRTLCEKQHVTRLTGFLSPWAAKNDDEGVCPDCLASPDFLLYLLATVGESPPDISTWGVRTGRFYGTTNVEEKSRHR